MKWTEVPTIWQECFNVAWESFQEGSRPIGAVVVNDIGKVISTGKSATFNELSNTVISHNELAHAEVNALLKIDNRVHKKVTAYTLYSTMEPCPLCFGAFYMSGIRNLEYAANDKYGGSTNLKDTTPYLSRKPIKIHGPIPYLEQLSILLHIYFDDMIKFNKKSPVHDAMAEDYPEAVALAKKWVKLRKLKDYKQLTVEGVYNMMMEELCLVTSK
jgi:tRNA(Arg) A34 adenosine deaminase TadA